jgi:FAD/FMN-containing dehydrogenase
MTGSAPLRYRLAQPAAAALPFDHLETLSGFGGSHRSLSWVYRPSRVDEVADLFRRALEQERKICLRGAGRSYGDAATLREEICLDLTRMNRILHWNPETGVLEAEPGATIETVWKHCLPDGWWPYVVSGTMFPTLGGALGMNIHGKNNWKAGTIGDHVLEFDLLTPMGEILTCSRDQNPDIFHAAIGGFGMLGVLLRIVLQLKRVYSGNLRVTPLSVPDLARMFETFEEHMSSADYLVGWMDPHASGRSLGRGLMHRADYLAEGEDPAPARTLQLAHQELPDTLFGLLPKSTLWRFMKPFLNQTGVRVINAAKYYLSRRSDHHTHLQSHAGFAFLLDYVPNWKRAYDPGGLIQYQCFLPAEAAHAAFTAILQRQQRAGLVNSLSVVKRHRRDDFCISHGVDGYSLAMDFRVTSGNRTRLWQLAAEMDRIVLQHGGRFYFAKDSTLTPETYAAFRSEPRFEIFASLKQRLDPNDVLQSDLFRRIFPDLAAR